VAVTAATFTASVAYGDLSRSPGSLLRWLAVFNLVILGILVLRRTYRFRLSGSLLDELSSVFVATGTAVVVVVALRSLLSVEPDSAFQTLRWGAFTAVNIAGVRVAGYALRRKRYLAGQGHKTLIIGAGTVGRQVSRRLLERPDLGLRPVGFLDREPRPWGGKICSLRCWVPAGISSSR